MGSGKTHQISKLLTNKKFKYVLFIAVRKTFTVSVSSKYNLMSYLDAQSKNIPLEFTDEHPKWIV